MEKSDRYNKHTIEWKDEMVRIVDKWRSQGQTIIAACKSASQELQKEVHPSLYQWWKGKQDQEVIAAEEEKMEATAPVAVVRKATPTATSGGKIKVTVKEYTFEGDHEQVMAAVTQLKNDGAN